MIQEKKLSEKRSLESNAIENLNLLEKKIALLIELLKKEKETTAQLMEEKNALTAQLDMLENSVLKGAKSIEELNQEREMTKLIVDELIGSIDRLVTESPEALDHAEQKR